MFSLLLLGVPNALAQRGSSARAEVEALYEEYKDSPMLPDEFLQQLDAIVAKHPKIPSDDIAYIQRLKGVFLAMEFGELDAARAIFKGLLRDHPNAPAVGPAKPNVNARSACNKNGVARSWELPRMRGGRFTRLTSFPHGV